MTPEISEFSYGFALTNELVGWASLRAAPVFPSLVEEGKKGGGYDVYLDIPGIPLYLQFKRADCMVRSNAWEIRDYNTPLSVPFYRFKITESGKSNQHELLRELDDGNNEVFYAAPRFHRLSEINSAWAANNVASNSIYISPNTIGALDSESHHIAYDTSGAFLCSTPREIHFQTTSDLIRRFQKRLDQTVTPLAESIPEMLQRLHSARDRAEAVTKVGPEIISEVIPSDAEGTSRISEAVPGRPPQALAEPMRSLREIADISAREFNTQLVIIQKFLGK